MVSSKNTVSATTTIITTRTTTATTTHDTGSSEYDPSLPLRREHLPIPSSKPKAFNLFKAAELKAVLLESDNIGQTVVDAFEEAGFQVQKFSEALVPGEQSHHLYRHSHLLAAIRTAHILGVGPKSRITDQVLNYASNLLAIGCFGPNPAHIDLQAAVRKDVHVYSSTFNHARSVAELVIGNIIALARQLGDRNREMHNGMWQKISRGCFEIRGKVLGIVGYGRVGRQVSMLAEALGLRVYFYDVVNNLMPFGCAQQVDSLEALLQASDFVSLHASSIVRLGPHELKQMKPGAYLINTMAPEMSSGLDTYALVKTLRSGHLAGAALELDPENQHDDAFLALRSCPNVILTPYIGCCTEETIEAIEKEVSTMLIKHVTRSQLAANAKIPEPISADMHKTGDQIDTKDKPKAGRSLNLHKQGNTGVLKARS
ncbi:hypothetical protein BX666DRAFT_2141426 [Dichotomocladium elegans]|nr:hypothetical protein BX666DRAFT_2141426 [Dichotomocladium elegans]